MGLFDNRTHITPSSELAGVSGLLSAFADRRMKQQQADIEREFRERQFAAQQANQNIDNARQDRMMQESEAEHERAAAALKAEIALKSRIRAEGGLDEIGAAIAQDPTGYQAQGKARKFGATISPFRPEMEPVPVPVAPTPVNTAPWAPPALGPHVNTAEEEGLLQPHLFPDNYPPDTKFDMAAEYDPTTNFVRDSAMGAVENRGAARDQDIAARAADQQRFAGEQQLFQDTAEQRADVLKGNRTRQANAKGVFEVGIPGGDPFFASADKAGQARLAAGKRGGEQFAIGHPAETLDSDFKQEALRRTLQAYNSGQVDLNKPDSGEKYFAAVEKDLRNEAGRQKNAEMMATHRGENLKLAQQRGDNAEAARARAMTTETLGQAGFKADYNAYKALNSILRANKAGPNSAIDVTTAGRFAMFAQGSKGVLTDSDVERFWDGIGSFFERSWSKVNAAINGHMGEDKRRIVMEALGTLIKDTEANMTAAQDMLAAKFDHPANASVARFKDAEMSIFPSYREAMKEKAAQADIERRKADVEGMHPGRGAPPAESPAEDSPNPIDADAPVVRKAGKRRDFGSAAPARKVLDTTDRPPPKWPKGKVWKADMSTEEYTAMSQGDKEAWMGEYERRMGLKK